MLTRDGAHAGYARCRARHGAIVRRSLLPLPWRHMPQWRKGFTAQQKGCVGGAQRRGGRQRSAAGALAAGA